MQSFQISAGAAGSASGQAQLAQALGSCAEGLSFPLAEADLLVVAATEAAEAEALRALCANAAPGAEVHGMSSCVGAMTERGVRLGGDGSLSILAIKDPSGSYGSAAVEFRDDHPSAVAQSAILMAIARAGRTGETPAAIWLNATPGQEEAVVAGIQAVVGFDVPIIGGSAADNSVSGNWFLFDQSAAITSGLTVTALFPSVSIGFAFHSGYAPTGAVAEVTEAEGRRLISLDGQPAAQVYNSWSDGAVEQVLEKGGDALMLSSLHPLGRKQGGKNLDGTDDYVLSHPARINADGSIDLFTDVAVGDRIQGMAGTPDNLVSRAGRVAAHACRAADIAPEEVAGALVIYCAGCMLTIQSRMDEVAASISSSLSGQPFLGQFTFGEQGCFVDGQSRHGNLMISALVFGSADG